MFHADYILLQSRPFDKNLVINKFSDLAYDVLAQFKIDNLDMLINSADKLHTPVLYL